MEHFWCIDIDFIAIFTGKFDKTLERLHKLKCGYHESPQPIFL